MAAGGYYSEPKYSLFFFGHPERLTSTGKGSIRLLKWKNSQVLNKLELLSTPGERMRPTGTRFLYQCEVSASPFDRVLTYNCAIGHIGRMGRHHSPSTGTRIVDHSHRPHRCAPTVMGRRMMMGFQSHGTSSVILRINIASTCARIEVQTDKPTGIPFRAICTFFSGDTARKIYMCISPDLTPPPRRGERGRQGCNYTCSRVENNPAHGLDVISYKSL